jgi:hypothetical protein
MVHTFRILVVENDPDATEYLRLVLVRTNADGDTENAAAPGHPKRHPLAGARAMTHATRSPTALILDDEPDKLAALTGYFHHAGYTVSAVADAEQALAMAPDVQPDVIVLDPGRHGREQTARLEKRFPSCLLVVTTVLTCATSDPGRTGRTSHTDHPASAHRR